MKTELTKGLDYYLELPYKLVLYRDSEGDWIATVEELPGCVAHAHTQAEVLSVIEEMKRAWIEDALEIGGPIPEPSQDETLPSGKWLQRVPRSLHGKLVHLAKKENVSLNQLVTSILAETVGKKSERQEERDASAADLWTAGVFLADHHGGGKWQIDQPVPSHMVDFVGALEFASSQVENTEKKLGTEKYVNKKYLTCEA